VTQGTEQCTCWQLPLTTGDRRPATWLFLQDRIAVTTRGGDRSEGTGEVAWAGPDTPLVSVEEDNSQLFWGCAPEDVAAVEVLSQTDADAVVSAVRAALADPVGRLNDGLYATVVTGVHETVEVTVKRRTWGCSPSGQ
jgi:hypothetical protein